MRASFCLLLLVTFFLGVGAAQDTLLPVEVTATRLRDVQELEAQVPGKVIVITEEDIQKLGAKTIQEVLQYQTGVVFYDNIGNEFQTVIDMRGFNGTPVPATSVFVDGVRVNEPDFNTINWDLMPIEDIERIEIMPGTATVYGRDALGGVINVTTKRGRTDGYHVGVDLGGGSYARQKYFFSTDGPLPFNFDYYFGVTRELTDGYRDASGGRITRIFTKLGYRLGDDTDATLAYTHVQNHLKQAGSLPADRSQPCNFHRNPRDNCNPGDFSDSDLNLVALNVRQRLPAGFSLAANGFFRGNDQESFLIGFSPGESTLRTETSSGGGTVQLTHAGSILGRKNLASLGAEYTYNRFNITNSGDFSGFTFLTKQLTTENVGGVYLTDSFSLLESLVLNAGFRYDWDHFDFTDKLDPRLNGKKSYDRVSPKTGLVYTPVPNLSLTFSYSQGIRMPTVNELFAQGPFGSNPNLLPMTSQNFELGAKGKWSDWLEGSLALYYTPVRDEIIFVVTDPVNFLGRNENVSRTLRRGIELSIKGRYGKWFDALVNYTFTRATFETDVLLFSGQVKKGDELPMVPQHHVTTLVNFYPLDGLTLSLFGNYVGKQFLFNDEPNQDKKLPDYFVLSSRMAYQWQKWTAYVTFNNLTNRKYATSGIIGALPPFFVPTPFFVPAPRFNVFGGITFRY